MKYAIGSDERTHLTDCVIAKLEASGAEPRLYGALNLDENPNWPHVAKKVAEQVSEGRCEQGILFCWTGTGVSMAANKVPGVRATLCSDAETAKGARLWNDANVLCMSLRLTSPEVAGEILDAWSASNSTDESEGENIDMVKHMDARRTGGK